MLYVTQRTNRHIVKALNSSVTPAIYADYHFGEFGVPGSCNTHLAFPWGVTVDGLSNVYVCDTKNQRVVKFDSSLNFIAAYSTTFTIGIPYAIIFDASTNSLYVTGVWGNLWVRIEKLTIDLTSLIQSGNLHPMKSMYFRPTSICRGFETNSFLISGANINLFETTETVNFSTFIDRQIYGEVSSWPKIHSTILYNSIIKHSDGNVYVNNGKKIIRVNSSFVNIGDSDVIAKSITGLKEGKLGSILTYAVDTQTVKRYDRNLNFVENVYLNGNYTIETDAYEIIDFAEI
jgi:hypothetical protein